MVPQKGVPPCVISHLLVQSRLTPGDMLLWELFLCLRGEICHDEAIAKPLGPKGRPEYEMAAQAEHVWLLLWFAAGPTHPTPQC